MGYRFLMAGKPKAGKTPSLAALANAGWRLRYLNFDGQAQNLLSYVKKEHRKNVQVVDCLDELRFRDGDYARSGGAQNLKSWTGLRDAMSEWPADKSKPKMWGEKDILVIDSLTYLAAGLARRLQVLNNREGKRFQFDDYSQTQKELDNLLACFKWWLDKAHLIVCAHVQVTGPDLHIESESEVEDSELRDRLLREKLNAADVIPWGLGVKTIGKAQIDFFASHFNGTIYVKHVEGKGRMIFTEPEDGFNAGVPFEGVKSPLPLATGMAEIFKHVASAGK